MINFTLYQWNTITDYLKECMKNNHKCAHCARYDTEHNTCIYARQCFINDMTMYDDEEDET